MKNILVVTDRNMEFIGRFAASSRGEAFPLPASKIKFTVCSAELAVTFMENNAIQAAVISEEIRWKNGTPAAQDLIDAIKTNNCDNFDILIILTKGNQKFNIPPEITVDYMNINSIPEEISDFFRDHVYL